MPLLTDAPLSTIAGTPWGPHAAEWCVLVTMPAEDRAARKRDWRLHKHADYRRVYQASRKQFAGLMTYFAAPQPSECKDSGARIGITAGKVMGKAVERNRIKRRMRAAIVANLDVLALPIDIVLHPKRSVLTADWAALRSDVRRVFEKVSREKTTKESKQREPQT